MRCVSRFNQMGQNMIAALHMFQIRTCYWAIHATTEREINLIRFANLQGGGVNRSLLNGIANVKTQIHSAL